MRILCESITYPYMRPVVVSTSVQKVEKSQDLDKRLFGGSAQLQMQKYGRNTCQARHHCYSKRAFKENLLKMRCKFHLLRKFD